MPKDFIKCIKDGGKVITRKIGKDKYIHLCKDKKGNWHSGEVKRRKNG